MTDWISVEDRLPQRWQEVVVRDVNKEIWCAQRSKGVWFCTSGNNKGLVIDASEWMPLPAPTEGL
jgi:hypothetical protein